MTNNSNNNFATAKSYGLYENKGAAKNLVALSSKLHGYQKDLTKNFREGLPVNESSKTDNKNDQFGTFIKKMKNKGKESND